MVDTRVNKHELHQLLKGAVASKEYKIHVQALFVAVEALKGGDRNQLNMFPLAQDYAIALLGDGNTDEFFRG